MSSNSENSAIRKQDSAVEKIRRFLFGDDVFISYSRVDSTYALTLANELTRNKLSCFLDQWGAPPGEQLPEELINTVKNCSMMVLVGSKHAAKSENVGLEVKKFLETRRPIIPITFVAGHLLADTSEDFNPQNLTGTLEQAEWYPLIAGIAKTTDTLTALRERKPSENVISRIVNAAEFRSRSRRLRKTFFATLAATAILLLLGGYAVYNAYAEVSAAQEQTRQEQTNARIAANNQKEAEGKLTNARNELSNTTQSLTDTKNQLANANTDLKNAEAQIDQAETQLNRAKQDLTAAQTEAELAQAKAEEQTKIAEEKRKEADKQAERSRQLAYATNLQLGSRLYQSGQINQLIDVLNETDEDLKGFEWSYLKHLNEGLIQFDEKQGDKINRIIFSPDKKYLAANGELSLSILNPQTGKDLTETIFGPDQIGDKTFSSVAFSPDGKLFAACGGNLVYLWKTDTVPWTEIPVELIPDPSTPELITKVVYKKSALSFDALEEFQRVSFNRDGSEMLLVGKYQEELFLRRFKIDVQKEVAAPVSLSKAFGKHLKIGDFAFDGRLLIEYKAGQTNQYSLYNPVSGEIKLPNPACDCPDLIYAFSPEGFQMALLNYTNKEIFVQRAFAAGVSFQELEDTWASAPWEKIVLSRNGTLAAALNENEVRIWNTITKKKLRTIPLKYKVAESIAFTPDGEALVIGGFDDSYGNGTLTLWNVYLPADAFTFNNERPLAISPDGASVVTLGLSLNGDLNLWDTLKKESRRIGTNFYHNDLSSVKFSPDKNYLITLNGFNTQAGRNISVKLNTKDGVEIPLKPEKECKFTPAVAFSPDSQKLVGVCEDDTVRVWDVKNGNERNELTITEQEPDGTLRDTLKNSPQIQIFASENKLIVSDYDGKFIAGWNSKNRQMLPLEICSEKILKYSPNGKWLITIDKKDNYRLRNENNKQCNQKALESDDGGLETAFSNDSRYLAGYYTSTQGSTSNVEYFIIDVTNNRKLNSPRAEKIDYSLGGGIYFSDSGRWVLFGNRIFDRTTGNVGKIVGCTANPAFSEAASINMSRLITTCGDGTLKFWSLISGQEVLSMQAHTSEVKTAILMKDNKYLLTATELQLRLWITHF